MWYSYGLVLLAGIANAVQPGQNATLAKSFSQPLMAGLVVGTGALLSILTIGLVFGRLAWPSHEEMVQVPWWAWLGGCLGGIVVITQLLIARQIGAGAFLSLLVTAGVITSILLDHFGWVGFEVHPASLWRVVGGALMIGGVVLVALF
ncbi:DMT family transporter [uncultured Methylobacterium sp.]|uniref:DMT family transporter n=1 Tax=uncultured Methylobacterium sp. TaxID=157278 RepID=UPI0035CB9285